MEPETTRSAKVVDDYKKHKLAISAYRRIEELLRGFERERATDLRLALVGIGLIAVLLAYLAFLFFSTDSPSLL